MRKSILFLTLSLFLFSCSRKPEFLTHGDPKYPISIKYLKKKMRVESYLAEPTLQVPEESYNIKVEIDISDEFPQESDPGIYDSLYKVIIYAPATFKGFGPPSYQMEESELNGTPAIVEKDEKGKIHFYKLLIPNLYAEIWLSGVDSRSYNPEEISQEYSDRREQLTYEMIKYFKWEQPIDTTTEEFKKWKEHIWEILKSGKKKQ